MDKKQRVQSANTDSKKNHEAMKQQVYSIENLSCAHCAGQMEEKIKKVPGIETVSITFATKQLKVVAMEPDEYLPTIREICTSLEADVKIVPKVIRKNRTKESRQDWMVWEIGIGSVLFFINAVWGIIPDTFGLAVYVLDYLLVGGRIVRKALQNIIQGKVFDENFLMTLATLGAFAIGEYPEAVGVMLFYRIGEYFEERAVAKSRSQIMDTLDLRPETVQRIVGTDSEVIAAEDAKVGDILMVRAGDRIPLDSVIVDGISRIDTSPITGEPVPVAASIGTSLISGSVNLSGVLKIRVVKVLAESMVSRILDSVENAAAAKPTIDRFITRFARIYTPVVVVAALLVAVIPSLITGNWNYWIYTALTFLVISCPCALVLSVPLAFFSGIGAGSKRSILFKGGTALEALSKVKHIIFDKTGTITEGDFLVQQIVPVGPINADELLALTAACERQSSHPIANSIVTAAREKNLDLAKFTAIEEVAGQGLKVRFMDKLVLCGNRVLLEKAGIDLMSVEKTLYGTEVFVAADGILLGYLVLADTVKAGAKNVIAEIKRLGIGVTMLTGDSQESASAIAAVTGIEEVRAGLLPQDKFAELTKIRDKYGAVMFIGDGINDAPVLAGADCGAAMGSGADAAIEAADVVFMTSKLDAVLQSLQIARNTNKIAWQNVVFALVVKIMVLVLGLAGFASMWFAVFADTGVAMLCVINAIRILYIKNSNSQVNGSISTSEVLKS